MNNPDFQPLILGIRESDLYLAKRSWIQTISLANETLGNLALFLELQEDIPTKLFFELLNLKASDKEMAVQIFLRKENNQLFGDMNIAALFEQKVLNPSLYEYLDYRARLLEQLRQAKREFPYSLGNLYNDDLAAFALNESFESDLQDYFTVKTSTPKENNLVEKIMKISDGLNHLVADGIIPENLGMNSLNLVFNMLKYENGTFKVHPRVLTNRRFQGMK